VNGPVTVELRKSESVNEALHIHIYIYTHTQYIHISVHQLEIPRQAACLETAFFHKQACTSFLNNPKSSFLV